MSDEIQTKEKVETPEKEEIVKKNCEMEENVQKHNGDSKQETQPTDDSSVDLKLHDSSKESIEDEEEEDEEMEESVDQSKNSSLDESKEDLDDSKKESGVGTGKNKRERKKVERFEQPVKKDDVEVKGSGTPLGEIPYIEKMLSRASAEYLKLLHRLCFNRPGTTFEIRRNLRKFRGFSFTEKDNKAYERKKHSVEKIVSAELKKIAEIIGVEKKGLKNELAEKIFKFLLSPHDLGKKIKEKRKSKGKGKKGKKSGPKKSKEKSEKKEKKKKVTPSEDVQEESDEEEEDESSEEEEDESSEDEKPPQKKAKPTPQNKKGAAKKRPKSSDSDDKDSSSDEEPLVKKVKKPPTDAEIKGYIKKILDKANLEEVTMKKLCQQVYDNYPEHDLSQKKDFIKSTVKSILS